MIGTLNTRQVRNLHRDDPCAPKRYDYMGSVRRCGSEILTRPGDGWEFLGASVKRADDGEGSYLLVRWRREVLRG